ncbi:MAG: hypothetical protein LUD53_06910 [Clostridiales bacterium]|nr:hypothetical protein [Clostridiales bacterium]
MNEKDEKRLLHEICRNSGMGREAIGQVLKEVYDEEFAYELHVEAGKMKEFEEKANDRLNLYHKGSAGAKQAAGKMLKTAVKMKTAFSDRTAHIADMMQKGNRRGADELKKAIHKYKDAGIYATELAREMVDFEEENLEKLEAWKREP